MTVRASQSAATAVKAVNAVLTALDTWEPKQATGAWVSIENTDGSQTYQGSLQGRPKYNVGTWGALASADWLDIVPSEMRMRYVDLRGIGEIRVIATASGAGGNCRYSRRDVIEAP